MKGRLLRSVGLLALVLPLAATACSKNEASTAGPGGSKPGGPGGRSMAFPVEVLQVTPRSVEYTVTAVGSVEAFERVEVTARVTGAVERVRFTEGAQANAGNILVEIEPERYRLVVASAQANVDREQAALAEARAGLARREAASAKNPGLIRGEEIETWRTRVETAAAELAQARAQLEQARLNLRDAFVRAPVSGTIQTRTVQTGQYVQPGTVLATLVRRDPLLLRFQVPEQESARIRTGMTARFRVAGDQTEHVARINHVAESANTASRMVAVTAHISDPNRASLTPGAFAQVTVPVGGDTSAPVIPQTAIRPSERGFLAFVVNGNKAQERILTLGMRTPDGQVEVKQGINPGDRLVIRGAEALRDGAEVRVEGQKRSAAGK
jgi:multidrug efflux system membrane fusion protein